MIMEVSNLTVKVHVTIPKEIRKIIGIKPGDKIYFELTENGIVI
ncbi:AbrB/MazE/SpoVT family DNA-binding domain-containing protein [Ferroplasma sp.]